MGKRRSNFKHIQSIADYSDLEQEAFLGFEHAVKIYNPDKSKFLSYLTSNIKWHLYNCLREMQRGNYNILVMDLLKNATFNRERGKRGFKLDDLWQIHLNIEHYKEPLIFKIKKGKKRFEQAYTRSEFSAKILSALNAARLKEKKAIQDLSGDSLEQLTDANTWTPDNALEEKELTIALEGLLLTLDEIKDNKKNKMIRLILTVYYGLNLFPEEIKEVGLWPGKDYNLREIGNVFGLTKERIRQLKDRGLKRLRNNARKSALRGIVDEYWFDANTTEGNN